MNPEANLTFIGDKVYTKILLIDGKVCFTLENHVKDALAMIPRLEKRIEQLEDYLLTRAEIYDS